MTFTILFLYHQLHVLDDKIKKEPATETNPQQALGLMKLYNVLSS